MNLRLSAIGGTGVLMTSLLMTSAVLAPVPGAVPRAPAAGLSPWVPTTTTYAPDDYTQQPLVGNGYLTQRLPAAGAGFEGAGTLGEGDWPLYDPRSTTAVAAGVYETSGASDYISTLPTWSDLSFGVSGQVLDASVPASQVSHYRQALDMSTGTVVTSFVWTPAAGEPATVTYTVLANRDLMHLGQVQATITPAWTGSLSVTSLLNGAGAQRITATARSVDAAGGASSVQLVTPGRDTTVAESARLVAGPGASPSQSAPVEPAGDTATAGVRWTVPVRAGTTYRFTKYVGISTSNDAGPPLAVAQDTVDRAVAMGWHTLVSVSNRDWAALWARRVTVNGQPSVQEAVNSSYYLLYVSLRAGEDYSIPPSGLSSDNYGGEIFWDADTWMFPSLLALHPELAKSIVMFRYDTIGAAEANAASAGYKGGSWAWDNGPSGTCGGLASCSHYEDHLQSDIALAQWQYYEATGDKDWLRSYGYPVLKDIAQFWASRVTLGSDGKYHIDGVTGPDEYASGVNDESATNAGAIVALREAVAAADVLGDTPDPSWSSIAANIYIDTSPDGTHPEYPGYTDQLVKQADTVLMSYPFGYVTDSSVAAADLNRYIPVTDPGGPAMTASVESVIAAQVQQPGCLDYTFFQDSYLPFLRGAYDQFNETQYLTPSAGQTNPAFDFATGAGGFLQTLTYGFAGLRWTAGALALDPTLPPQLSSGITITGLQYQGRAVNLSVGPRVSIVTLASGRPLKLSSPDGTRTLAPGRAAILKTARPDQDPTDNLARCQAASASSSEAVDLPAAAVDGDAVTSWTAAGITSSYTVALARTAPVGHVDVTWGPTRPASYTIQARTRSGQWTEVASGSVPPTGNLDATWPPAAATALRLSFSGGSAASIAELYVPDASGPDVVTALSAPDAIAPGTSATVTLTASSIGGSDATHVSTTLSLPSGWTATPDSVATTIAKGATATDTWTVTAPAGQARVPLTATTSWQGTRAPDSTTSSTTVYTMNPVAPGEAAQAEDAILSGGATPDDNHAGYTGTGFVDDLYNGATITIDVDVPTAGQYPVAVRYANWTGGQSAPYQTVTRTISLVAGGSTQQLSLPTTGSWDTWSTVTANATLRAGQNVIQLAVGPEDSGSVNIDCLTAG
ncbi:MAG TPA: NEW3 domain-containing protein [Trebonia sp.]|nr:NEW3 domain-containing protein [Trebonia sp.]